MILFFILYGSSSLFGGAKKRKKRGLSVDVFILTDSFVHLIQKKDSDDSQPSTSVAQTTYL
jgi:hypothetical protein